MTIQNPSQHPLETKWIFLEYCELVNFPKLSSHLIIDFDFPFSIDKKQKSKTQKCGRNKVEGGEFFAE